MNRWGKINCHEASSNSSRDLRNSDSYFMTLLNSLQDKSFAKEFMRIRDRFMCIKNVYFPHAKPAFLFLRFPLLFSFCCLQVASLVCIPLFVLSRVNNKIKFANFHTSPFCVATNNQFNINGKKFYNCLREKEETKVTLDAPASLQSVFNS